MSDQLRILKPRNALNKAFLKVKPNRSDIERFKTYLIQLLDRINDSESEEFHKNLVIDFLKKTWYEPNHFINTKGRNDLVIHNGDKATHTVGVIIEAKKPGNKVEMATKDNINVKAFQELVLYYLRERITQKNIEIKYLIATNINEWFIFDATLFDRLFAQNSKFVKQFTDFESGRLADTKTDFFYKQIVEPFISEINHEIEFAHFDIRDYEKPLRNKDKNDDNQLIALFKLLSPEHLLKLPFANDSNSLDKRFYNELLHLIGLTETKDGSKKIIGRNKEGERNSGSLIENAIIQLDSLDKVSRLENPGQFAANLQERLFNVGLELCITWINRILFLKLLEAQLVTYHKGDKSYEFLNLGKIRDYDNLNSLFFQVLARRHDERHEDVKITYVKVPYLNSSLFEPTEIEHATFFISQLRNDKTMPVYTSTVLKDDTGKKRVGPINPLQYFFDFLNAYDFASEGSEEIQEDNKTLINASVLGLIFEKINGYKDGSFFTPGFITMYMCRETIRKAVIQRFNQSKGWNCTDITSLYNKIEDRYEANQIINGLKICDPAVGSGHFLVSALNEMIAIKSDLKILMDRKGKRLKEYHFEVVNDELMVTDEDGDFFEYNCASRESQRVQETLFHEKQTIIENCLFGVDINPNSVKICRLRLWIELLKNTYNKNERELETLPNIDINIKCGNSLISRYKLSDDVSDRIANFKDRLQQYRFWVDEYKRTDDKQLKRRINENINSFIEIFRYRDPRIVTLERLIAKKSEEYLDKFKSNLVFEHENKEGLEKQKVKIGVELGKLTTELEQLQKSKLFANAFEWRFEFPEVLNENGDFMGFDVVIGNPPYIRQEELSSIKPYLQSNYQSFTGIADLYVFFVERGINILKNGGTISYILPNKWMRAGYGIKLRNWVKQFTIRSIIDFGELTVFDEATTYPCLLALEKSSTQSNSIKVAVVNTVSSSRIMETSIEERKFFVAQDQLDVGGWKLVNETVQNLIQKIKYSGKPLHEYFDGQIFRGILTGLNEAFVIDEGTKNKLIEDDPNSIELIRPFLAGRDIKRYQQPISDKWLILIPKGFTIRKNLPEDSPYHISEPVPRYGTMPENVAWAWFVKNYPAIADHLKFYKEKAEKRSDMGDYWWELRACDYYSEFEKIKIVWPGISDVINCFAYDSQGYYGNDNNHLIITEDTSLLALLNSSLCKFYLMNTCDYVRGGFVRLKISYVSSFTVHKNFSLFKDDLSALSDKILRLRSQNSNCDTSYIESEIDQLVYVLYGLTAEEIELIGKSIK